ncbi:MAG: DUF3592 domain-containing protein [Candidatus Poseidoniaceae archaeon]|nr:DUF3592 domain-containing protein [Candidatus Poseidoniaceae archaeon]
MTTSDASTPFWDAAEAPEGLGGTQEPSAPSTNESASEAVPLAILPAAPVAAAPQADVGRMEPVSVQDTPSTANDGEENGVWGGFLFILFFAVFWVGGTAVATVAITGDLAEQHSTRTWDEIPGVMDRSWVDEEVSCGDEGCSTNYCVYVEYSYGYGNLLSGDELSKMEDCYASSGLAEKLIERYPAGDEVTVYHHPDDINETVLETGLSLRYMWLLVFLLPFQLVSLALLYVLQSVARRAISGPASDGS